MLHSFPQSIFRKKTGSLAYCFHVTLSVSISTFYTSVQRNHKYLKGTFVTKPVHFQSQYRQSKKQPFSELLVQLQYFILTCFHKIIFYLFLNSFMQGLKTTVVLSFRKTLMIASTLPDLQVDVKAACYIALHNQYLATTAKHNYFMQPQKFIYSEF